MTGQRTAPLPRVTEHQKARVRLPLLTFLALLGPPLTGVRSASVWVFYVVFVVLYSLWSLRLSRHFSGDRRLGYLLVPHRHRHPPAAAGVELRGGDAGHPRSWYALPGWRSPTGPIGHGRRPLPGLQPDRVRGERRSASARSDRSRTRRPAWSGRCACACGSSPPPGLVSGWWCCASLRFEETASYYGEEASERVLSAVSRRGLRLLGPDAQHFPLPGGRVAFLFETEPGAARADVARRKRHSDGAIPMTSKAWP